MFCFLILRAILYIRNRLEPRCMGNLANLERNRHTLIDKKCGERILEILNRLDSGSNVNLSDCVYML